MSAFVSFGIAAITCIDYEAKGGIETVNSFQYTQYS